MSDKGECPHCQDTGTYVVPNQASGNFAVYCLCEKGRHKASKENKQ